MRGIILCVVLLVSCIHWLEATSLNLGDIHNTTILKSTKINVNGFPFFRVDKDYTYTDYNCRIIKGIKAYDYLVDSKAKVTVTAGGIGKTHVTLHLESERGSPLSYLVQIYI